MKYAGQICLWCMREKALDGNCPQCGGDSPEIPDVPGLLKPGSILHDKYIVGRILGQGGFAVTYIGRQLDLGSRVAIKEYFPQEFVQRGETGMNVIARTTTDRGMDCRKWFRHGLERFVDEGRNIVQCHQPQIHPNLVRVMDYFEENGTAYLVMDYVDGCSLEVYLKKLPSGRLPEEHALRLILPIAEGLQTVHAKGFLHRDIKPSNIFLSRELVPILIDFGSARQALGSQVRTMTVMLTHGYAPPEQYSNAVPQGPWTDVYALGATLYRMLTGASPASAMDRVMGMPVPRPSSISGVQVSRHVESALMASLAQDPKERPQTIRDLSEALLGQGSACSSSIRMARKPKITKQKRSHKLSGAVWASLGALLVVVGLYAAQAYISGQDEVGEFWRRWTSSAANSLGDTPAATPLVQPLPVVTAVEESALASAATVGDSVQWLDIALCYIPPGRFMMGSTATPDESSLADDEIPAHEVALTTGFWIGKWEVTKAEWAAVMGSTPWADKPDAGAFPRTPAVYVTWADASAFCAKLNEKCSMGAFGLPTEAEWEYACRAGSSTRYPWGDAPEGGKSMCRWPKESTTVTPDKGFLSCASTPYTSLPSASSLSSVASYAPNTWGLYDMTGNAWEWCADWYGPYPAEQQTDPRGPETGDDRVIRGGGMEFDPQSSRSAYRGSNPPEYAGAFMGFRVVYRSTPKPAAPPPSSKRGG